MCVIIINRFERPREPNWDPSVVNLSVILSFFFLVLFQLLDVSHLNRVHLVFAMFNGHCYVALVEDAGASGSTSVTILTYYRRLRLDRDSRALAASVLFLDLCYNLKLHFRSCSIFLILHGINFFLLLLLFTVYLLLLLIVLIRVNPNIPASEHTKQTNDDYQRDVKP